MINKLFKKVSCCIPPKNQDILLFDELQNSFYSCRLINYDFNLTGLVYFEIYLPNKDMRIITITSSDFLNYYQWSYLSDIVNSIDTIY